MRNETTGRRLFHGWIIVVALFLILLFTGGGGFYVFPVYIDSLINEFGWSMTQISASAAVWAIVFGLSAPLVGLLIARFGVRFTMLSAACASALTLLGFSAMRELWMLYAIQILAGFAVAGTTLVPSQTLITNWFNVYRGRAMSWAMLGIGSGGFLLPPLNAFLIRHLGWRTAWAAGALIVIGVVVPLIVFFIRTRPSDLALVPDGRLAPGSSVIDPSGLSVRQATRTPEFWLLCSIYVLQLTGLSTMNFHFVPFATRQAAFPSQTAAGFFGIMLGFSLAGRLFFGWLADRRNPAAALAGAAVLLALGPAVLLLVCIRLDIRESHFLWLYALPFGLGVGGNAVLLPVIVGRCFGERHFSKIMGLIMGGFAIGILAGIPAAGKLYDLTRSYAVPFSVSVAAFLFSGIFALLVRPGRLQRAFLSTPRRTSACDLAGPLEHVPSRKFA